MTRCSQKRYATAQSSRRGFYVPNLDTTAWRASKFCTMLWCDSGLFCKKFQSSSTSEEHIYKNQSAPVSLNCTRKQCTSIKWLDQATIPRSHGHGWCRSPGHWRRPCLKYQSKDAWEPLLPANQVLLYNRLHSLIDKRLACYLFEAMPRWQFEAVQVCISGDNMPLLMTNQVESGLCPIHFSDVLLWLSLPIISTNSQKCVCDR